MIIRPSIALRNSINLRESIVTKNTDPVQPKNTRILSEEISAAPLRANFAQQQYQKNGASTTHDAVAGASRAGNATYPKGALPINVYSDGVPRLTSDGQVLERASVNLISDSAFSGAAVGTVTSGSGKLPTGGDLAITGAITCEVLSVSVVGGAERLRMRWSWTGGQLTGAFPGWRPCGYNGAQITDSNSAVFALGFQCVTQTGVKSASLLLREKNADGSNYINAQGQGNSSGTTPYPLDGTFSWLYTALTGQQNNYYMPELIFEITDISQDGSITFDVTLVQLESGTVPSSWIRTPARAPVVANDGTISANITGPNQVPDPTFTGAVAGVVGSGGALPTGMTLSLSTITREVVSVGTVNGQRTVRLHFSRSSGSPTGTSLSIRPCGYPGLTISTKGLLFCCGVKVVSQTGITGASLLLQEYDPSQTFLQNTVSDPISLDGSLQWRAIFRGLTNTIGGQSVSAVGHTFMPAISLSTTSSTSDFDIVLDVLIPYVQYADSLFAEMNARQEEHVILLPGAGNYDLFLQNTDKGEWRNHITDSGSGILLQSDSATIPDVIAFSAGSLTVDQKTDLASVLYPPTPVAVSYSTTYDFAISITKFRPRSRRTDSATWPIQRMGNKQNHWRFEVRPGDIAAGDPVPGAPGVSMSSVVERSELEGFGPALPPKDSNNFKFNCDIWWSYSFFFEPGSQITADWVVVGQWHNTRDDGTVPGYLADQAGQSPPLACLLLPGDVFQISTRTDPNQVTTRNPPPIVQYETLLQRGKWHHIVMMVNFDWRANGSGRLKSWMNGQPVVDFTGPIGYNDALWHFPKFGIYRGINAPRTSQPTDTMVVHYANMEFGTPYDSVTDLSDRILNPLPVV